MCGILIFKEKNLTNKTKEIFKSTLDGLKNRGPDELKIVQNKNILVGFTRLSINDIENASQLNQKKIKIGTPSFFGEVMYNKKEINNFKEAVFFGECRKLLNPETTIKKIKGGYKKEDSIFLWKLYIFNKIFYNF